MSLDNMKLDESFLADYIKNNYDSTEILREVFLETKISKWEKESYDYFSKIYDSLYHDLLLKKLNISIDTKKMLELMATPIYQKNDLDKEKIYKKIIW